MTLCSCEHFSIAYSLDSRLNDGGAREVELSTQVGIAAPVLEVNDLQTVFNFRGSKIFAVNGVSFRLAPGELLGVVGESGSGKCVTMMSLMGLLPMPPAEIVSGRSRLAGRDAAHASTSTRCASCAAARSASSSRTR